MRATSTRTTGRMETREAGADAAIDRSDHPSRRDRYGEFAAGARRRRPRRARDLADDGDPPDPGQLPVGPRVIPYIVGGGLVVTGLWLAIDVLRRPRRPPASETRRTSTSRCRPTGSRVGLLALALIALPAPDRAGRIHHRQRAALRRRRVRHGQPPIVRDVVIGVVLSVGALRALHATGSRSGCRRGLVGHVERARCGSGEAGALGDSRSQRFRSVALTPENLLWALVGVILGTFVGVLPGIGPALTVALLLPVTYDLEPVSAFIMFAGIYYGGMYGGSTTSILLNTPGESASIVTALEGNKMAKRGRGAAALATAAIGSFVAGTLGTLASPSSRR